MGKVDRWIDKMIHDTGNTYDSSGVYIFVWVLDSNKSELIFSNSFSSF